jgi:DNA-binding transcriptional LysR family regulator
VSFLEAVPDYQCEICLKEGKYDFALLAEPIDKTMLVSLPLYRDVLFIWVNKEDDLAKKTELHKEDLSGRNVIFLSNEFKTGVAFENYCKSIPEQFALSSADEMIQVLRSALLGDCLAVTVREHAEVIKVESLIAIPFVDFRWGFSLCYKKERIIQQAEQAFLDHFSTFARFYD